MPEIGYSTIYLHDFDNNTLAASVSFAKANQIRIGCLSSTQHCRYAAYVVPGVPPNEARRGQVGGHNETREGNRWAIRRVSHLTLVTHWSLL